MWGGTNILSILSCTKIQRSVKNVKRAKYHISILSCTKSKETLRICGGRQIFFQYFLLQNPRKREECVEGGKYFSNMKGVPRWQQISGNQRVACWLEGPSCQLLPPTQVISCSSRLYFVFTIYVFVIMYLKNVFTYFCKAQAAKSLQPLKVTSSWSLFDVYSY